MTQDLKDKFIKSDGKLLFPEARLRFHNIVEPYTGNAKPSYSATIFFDRSPEWDVILKYYQDELWRRYPDKKVPFGFIHAYKIGTETPPSGFSGVDIDAYPEYEGKIIMKVGGQFPFPVHGPDNVLWDNTERIQTQVLPGSYCHIAAKLNFYSHPGGKTGAVFRPLAYQFTRPGEYISGKSGVGLDFFPAVAGPSQDTIEQENLFGGLM